MTEGLPLYYVLQENRFRNAEVIENISREFWALCGRLD